MIIFQSFDLPYIVPYISPTSPHIPIYFPYMSHKSTYVPYNFHICSTYVQSISTHHNIFPIYVRYSTTYPHITNVEAMVFGSSGRWKPGGHPESWDPAVEGTSQAEPRVNQQKSKRSTIFDGKSPFLMGTSPCLIGESPFLMGTSPCWLEKSPFLMGKSPCLIGKTMEDHHVQ